MWSILALGAVERLINQLINMDAITRIQFNQLQGKLLRVVIDSPQLSVDVYFDEEFYKIFNIDTILNEKFKNLELYIISSLIYTQMQEKNKIN